MNHWSDPLGVIHIFDDVILPDGTTWCGRNGTTLPARSNTNLPPTCVRCIVHANRFYNLPNVRTHR